MAMPFKSLLLAGTVALLTIGCDVHPQFKLTPVKESEQSHFVLEDHRPLAERQSEILSLMVTNPAYGIARMGDDRTVPDRMAYLKAFLGNEVGAKLEGKTVLVKSFAIHRNNQGRMRGTNPSKSGLLTAAISNALEEKAAPTQPGGFTEAENPDGFNVAVIDLLVTVDGKDYRARVVKPAPGTVVRFNGDVEIWDKVVASAMEEVVVQLSGKLKQG
ncbi:MAG TPA: hypothetical protein VJ505_09050 [Holophagaceae bacterium]|nr:hypothetical protein [Holophagaceae bacterium]